MKVLVLSWEYPPRTVGGLARHVAGLSRALAQKNVDMNVVTISETEQETYYHEKGVSVYTVPAYPLPTLNFIHCKSFFCHTIPGIFSLHISKSISY